MKFRSKRGVDLKICPICEQGLICEVIIKATNEKLYLCEECEALWINDSIDSKEVLNFDEYMKKRNLKPIWDELVLKEII